MGYVIVHFISGRDLIGKIMAKVYRQPTATLNVRQKKPAEEVAKSQTVRVLDVLLYGPVMIMSALNKEPPELMRLALLGIGVGTVFYNLHNWYETRRLENEAKQNGNRMLD